MRDEKCFRAIPLAKRKSIAQKTLDWFYCCLTFMLMLLLSSPPFLLPFLIFSYQHSFSHCLRIILLWIFLPLTLTHTHFQHSVKILRTQWTHSKFQLNVHSHFICKLELAAARKRRIVKYLHSEHPANNATNKNSSRKIQNSPEWLRSVLFINAKFNWIS